MTAYQRYFTVTLSLAMLLSASACERQSGTPGSEADEQPAPSTPQSVPESPDELADEGSGSEAARPVARAENVRREAGQLQSLNRAEPQRLELRAARDRRLAAGNRPMAQQYRQRGAGVDDVRVARPLNPEQGVTMLLRRQRHRVYRCYVGELEQDPDLGEGTLSLQLTIGPQGRLTATEVVQDDIGSESLSACVVDRLEALEYPTTGSEVTVTHPFSFRQRDRSTE